MPILNSLLNGFRSAVGGGDMPPPAAPPLRSPLPGISAGEGAENRRTVDAVLKSHSDGLVPDIYAGEIASRGAAGRAYFHDFDQQLRRHDAGRADSIRAQVLDRLAPDDRERTMMHLAAAAPGNRRSPATPLADPAERLRRDVVGHDWPAVDADARVVRHRAGMAKGADTEDGRYARLLETGITDASARELAARLSNDDVNQFVQDWGDVPASHRDALERLLTSISGFILQKKSEYGYPVRPTHLPTGGGIRG